MEYVKLPTHMIKTMMEDFKFKAMLAYHEGDIKKARYYRQKTNDYIEILNTRGYEYENFVLSDDDVWIIKAERKYNN